MEKKNSILKNRFFVPSFTILSKSAGLFKVSCIVGSMSAFFSGSAMIVPLSGAFGGVMGATGVFALTLLMKLLFFGVLSFKYLAYHIPGYFASLYWASQSRVMRGAVPVVCMILFIAHPVGLQAFAYTFYWLIPIALQFFNKKTVFLDSVGSTLTAHAVGSVIWLYAMPMTPLIWIGLIPVVFVERLAFALGMTLAYHALSWMRSKVTAGYHGARVAKHAL